MSVAKYKLEFLRLNQYALEIVHFARDRCKRFDKD